LRAFLFASSALIVVGPSAARAADAVWVGGAPATPSDYGTAANWTPAGPPDGTASFGASANTNVSVFNANLVGGWTFNAGAFAYTFTNNGIIGFSGSGITINSGSATITNNGGLQFSNASTAGSASITNTGLMIFTNTSTAGSAAITNNGALQFFDTSTAGSATITNNVGGTVQFGDTTTAGSAAITNGASAATDFSGSSGPNGDHKLSAGSLAGGGTFFLGQNELTVGSNNLSTTVTGVIADGGIGGGVGGSLVKIGTGSLTLSGSNTYTGGTTINGGTLQLGDGGGVGAILNTVTVGAGSAFDVVNADTSGITSISNAGTTNFYNGTSAGSAAITNSGSLDFNNTSTAGSASITNNSYLYFLDTSTAGSAAITNGAGGITDFSQSTGPNTAGSLAGAGTFVLGANELTVGSNNLSTTVTGVIADGGAGGGSLVKVGTGTLALAGINTYTGATTVNGGTLEIDGSIAASSGVTVNSGAALGGTGTVSSTMVASGGTLAPGQSIGTLSVNGNLTFNSGAVYAVDVSPAAADRTSVTGTATLAGTVVAAFQPGSYVAKDYTILSATLLNGTFDSLTTSNLPSGSARAFSTAAATCCSISRSRISRQAA
jgi:autotransporter-associated beta strand protein